MFGCCESRNNQARPDEPAINRGVGIVCHPDRDGRLLIHSLSPGGPAERCGQLRVGDMLFSINDTEVVGMHVSMVAPLLSGEPGSVVKLVFKRNGDADVCVSLRRGWYPQANAYVRTGFTPKPYQSISSSPAPSPDLRGNANSAGLITPASRLSSGNISGPISSSPSPQLSSS